MDLQDRLERREGCRLRPNAFPGQPIEQNAEACRRLRMAWSGVMRQAAGVREDRRDGDYRTGFRRRRRTMSAPLGTMPALASVFPGS
jgi:hypothetical protein